MTARSVAVMNSGRMRNDGNSGTMSVQDTVSFGAFVKEASFEMNARLVASSG